MAWHRRTFAVMLGVTSALGLVPASTLSSKVARWSTVAEKEEEVVLTPAEEEASLTTMITGKPTVGVVGLFDEPSRTDQFLLDVLHAQGVWGSIVGFSADPAAAKKKLMSRSARYSGLLDVLKLEEVTPPEQLASALTAADCGAVVVFGAEPDAVNAYLAAAKDASSCSRVVIAATGPVSDGQISAADDSLDWTVVALDVEALVDDEPEGGPVAIDAAATAPGSIARQDAYRVLAEALVVAPLAKKKVALSRGNDYAVKYLRTLREQGYTRRGEIAKIMAGGLAEFEKQTIADEEAAKADAESKSTVDQDEREAEYKKLMEEAIREEQEKRDKAIASTARDYLARQWTEKKYSSARGLTKEEFIEIEWSKGVKEAAAILGYTTKDKARGISDDDDDDDDDDEDDDKDEDKEDDDDDDESESSTTPPAKETRTPSST